MSEKMEKEKKKVKALLFLNSNFDDDWCTKMVVNEGRLQQSFKSMGANENDIVIYKNLSKETFDTMCDDLCPVFSLVLKNEIVYMYFFGHGSTNGFSMNKKDTYLSFNEILEFIYKFYGNVTCVLMLDCCCSGDVMKEWEIPMPNLHIIGSTSTESGATIYGKNDMSVFAEAWCKIVSEIPAGTHPSGIDLVNKVDSEVNKILKLHNAFMHKKIEDIRCCMKSVEEAGGEAVGNLPTDSVMAGFMKAQMALNNNIYTFLSSVGYHIRVSRTSHRSIELYRYNIDANFLKTEIDIGRTIEDDFTAIKKDRNYPSKSGTEDDVEEY
jgi:hypothetical protein